MLYITVCNRCLAILRCRFWMGNADVFTTSDTHICRNIPISSGLCTSMAKNFHLRSFGMDMAYANLWNVATAKKRKDGMKSELLTKYYADERQP